MKKLRSNSLHVVKNLTVSGGVYCFELDPETLAQKSKDLTVVPCGTVVVLLDRARPASNEFFGKSRSVWVVVVAPDGRFYACYPGEIEAIG